MFLLLSDQSICPSQAKFQALLAVAVFMFKIEFWVKNERAIFSAGGPGGAVSPLVGVRGQSLPKIF